MKEPEFDKALRKWKVVYDRMKEVLEYNPDTGLFKWKVSLSNRVKAGDTAGSFNKDHYVRIMLDGKNHLAHRLAWLYVHGEYPDGEIDHINHVKTDNRIDNLRAVDPKDNKKNMSKLSTNTSGITGVGFYRGRWKASIQVDRVNRSLGSYKDFFEAVCARKSAEVTHEFHPNHGR